MRYHLTPVKMAIIKKSTNKRCWQGCGEKGTLLHCWWDCKLIQPLWRTVWRFLKKLEIELPYDPAIPLLGIHTEERKMLFRVEGGTTAVKMLVNYRQVGYCCKVVMVISSGAWPFQQLFEHRKWIIINQPVGLVLQPNIFTVMCQSLGKYELWHQKSLL